MEIRKILLFIVLSALILIGWQFMVFKFFPPPAPVPQAQNDKPGGNDAVEVAGGEDEPVEAPLPDPQKSDRSEYLTRAKEPAGDTLTLGGIGDDSRFFLGVELTRRGAAIETIRLGGKKFRELRSSDPLTLAKDVATGEGADASVLRTFQTSIHQVNGEIQEIDETLDLNRVNWEVADRGTENGHEFITFRFALPGGRFEILKRYALAKVPDGADVEAARKTFTDGYLVHMTLTVNNLTEGPQAVSYELLGPVGMPLENEDNTRKYRDVKWEYIQEDGSTEFGSPYTAADIAEATKDDPLDPITAPVLYAGVDLQYFAGLVYPTADPTALVAQPQPAGFIQRVDPILVEKDATEAHSDISVRFVSDVLTLEPGGSLTNDYTLYVGPKREALLDPISAGDVIEYGLFAWLGRGMVWLLNFFHNTLYIPYAIAIICLTVVVRGILFPLSRKQAIGAQRMKELQPKIAELKKKYGHDKEKFARAQMELFRKTGYNPLSGCWPILLQFPIFIALYNALNTAVDLRRAEFLWIDNLGGPDELFPLGFTIPLVGWTHFNLLPILTVVLFIVQQKMFLPDPNPADEQAMLQHRLMKFMTIFLGFLFYRVPAGLCIYFIASSLWGIGERKFLNLSTHAHEPAAEKKSLTANGDAGPGAAPRNGDGRGGSKRSKSKKSKPRR